MTKLRFLRKMESFTQCILINQQFVNQIIKLSLQCVGTSTSTFRFEDTTYYLCPWVFLVTSTYTYGYVVTVYLRVWVVTTTYTCGYVVTSTSTYGYLVTTTYTYGYVVTSTSTYGYLVTTTSTYGYLVTTTSTNGYLVTTTYTYGYVVTTAFTYWHDNDHLFYPHGVAVVAARLGWCCRACCCRHTPSIAGRRNILQKTF